MNRFSLLTALVVVLTALSATAKVTVISTTPDPGAIARAIGGDRVDVTALCRGYQDPHFIEAKPSDMLRINRADLVLSIGMDLEIGWLPPLLRGARNPRVLPGQPGYLDLSTLIAPLDVGAADRSMGDVHPKGNPHYWLDPENGRLLARGIAKRLTELDPKGGPTFLANLKLFETKLDEKMAEWTGAMAALKGAPIVTFHTSWSYFAKRFGLDVVGYIEPKPGLQPTARHTVETIRLVRTRGVKVLLVENYYDRRSPDQIASHTDAKVVFVPNMVGGTAEATDTFALFDNIVSAIAREGQ